MRRLARQALALLDEAMGLLRLALTVLLAPPVFLIAALCAGASVAAQQGRTSLRWDVLAHFAPIWFLGALGAMLIALIAFRGLSRWLILAMGLVGVVAAGSLIVPEFTRSTGPHAAADAPGQLKIIQFNVWSENDRPEATVDWIAAQHPDIAILEETTPEFRRLVEARTGWRSTCRDCEVMIYSRLPMAKGYVGGGPAVGPLAHAVFRDDRGAFDVVGVHNGWPTDRDATRAYEQQRQEARLARVLGELPRERTIATGDFNSTPWSFARRHWDQAFGLPRRDRALFSWPAGQITARRIKVPLPFLPIDHVYAGPGWATVSVTRGPKLGSDHYPVVAILAPAGPR
jgi:endonuclease/exonuclease/phosphatase (EEP) superfamily protein YafD